ncbi:uncharacterized protein METZ01_LOCUS62240 [marine metagenome]|uniref:Uncharacterized protein n=1 Tax=marine metagenome TaxID=408172 RepID=A0A381SZN2_9ZZZZ
MPDFHHFFLRQQFWCNLILEFVQSIHIDPAESPEQAAPEGIPAWAGKETGDKVNDAGLACFIQQHIVQTAQVTMCHTVLMHGIETMLKLCKEPLPELTIALNVLERDCRHPLHQQCP